MGERRRVVNLMATMLLGGLWHGAAWNFVLWGGLHGTYLVTHTQYRRWFPPLPRLLGQALTLLAVIVAWVPFRAGGYADTMAMLRGMAGLNGIALPRMIVAAFPPLAAVVRPGRRHALPRRCPHAELSGGLRLPAAGMADRADPAERPADDGAGAALGAGRGLRADDAGAVLRAARRAVPVFPVLMRRILLACAASLLLYALAFACLLDRPLTLGALRARIDANLATGATIAEPKLVILAGSNGPYSHRCKIIGPLINRPCVNAGVAVGVGLDYLFPRWEALLHPGDVVYLPLEEAQYVRAARDRRAGTRCRHHAAP